MGGTTGQKSRHGSVTTVFKGQRWLAQLDLYERSGEKPSPLRIDVPGRFIDRKDAAKAGEGVLKEWLLGAVTIRELVLRELAAAYRHLRGLHKTMEPVAVPTTSAAWGRALELWELAGWLDPAEAARYREHARLAFDSASATVTRHLLSDAKAEPEP